MFNNLTNHRTCSLNTYKNRSSYCTHEIHLIIFLESRNKKKIKCSITSPITVLVILIPTKTDHRCVCVRPCIRKGPFSELALPVLVRVPVLERADFLIPVLELAPFLESLYAQAAISRTSTTNFVPFLVLASQF